MMAYSSRRSYRTRTRTRIFRKSRSKLVAGVCSGLAEYFDVPVGVVRLGFLVPTLVGFPLPFILYLCCIFMMPSDRDISRDEVRFQVPPIPRFAAADVDLTQLNRHYDQIEARIRSLEDHVTSREYVLKRKFEDL